MTDDVTNDIEDKQFTPEQSDRYVVAMSEIFREYGVIRTGDTPGRDFVLIRESEQVEPSKLIIERLRESDAGTVVVSDRGETIFHPHAEFVEKLAMSSTNRRAEFRKRGIVLERQGRATCQLLDATTFRAPINSEILHLIILDRAFASQQDKTYALLRALGFVTQDLHNNVFFDSQQLSPALATYVFAELLADHTRRYVEHLDRWNTWNQFDPEEYQKQFRTKNSTGGS